MTIEYDTDPIEAFNMSMERNMWVFGYGSLMWNPEFDYVSSHPGHICGYHRRFCLTSKHYRGTEERPGLVLGLDRGGSCRGVLFEVEISKIKETLDKLWVREQKPAGVYKAKRLPIVVDGDLNNKVSACVFVINRQHPYYFPETCRDIAASLIHQAKGDRGTNIEYLENTVKHLRVMNIKDKQLEDLLSRVLKNLGRTE